MKHTWRATDGTVITWSPGEGVRVEGSSPFADRLRRDLARSRNGRVNVEVAPHPGGSLELSLDCAWTVHRWVWTVPFHQIPAPYIVSDYEPQRSEAPPKALELLLEREENYEDLPPGTIF